MSSADFQLDGNILSVSWADNRSMNDCSGAAQVIIFLQRHVRSSRDLGLRHIYTCSKRNVNIFNLSLIQVKTLYVKNIPDDSTIDQLKELFERHGEVMKVVLPQPKSGDNNKRSFGFVYYAERSSAIKAVKESQTYEIKGKLFSFHCSLK